MQENARLIKKKISHASIACYKHFRKKLYLSEVKSSTK